MAFVPVTDAVTSIGETTATLNGSWTGATLDPYGYSIDAKFTITPPGSETPEYNYATENGSHSDIAGDPPVPALNRDTTYSVSFRARDQDGSWVGASPVSFRTHAPSMVFGTPHVGATRDIEADVDIDFTPNTYESTASVKVQVKLYSDPPASYADGSSIGALYGFGQMNLDYTITGLLANTHYSFRFVALRNTTNDTSLTSAEGDFWTASEPSGGAGLDFFD